MPLGESMISVVKSNKSIMLDKSSHFKKTEGGYESSKTNQFNFPDATPEVLLSIREKIQRENRQTRKKQMIVFVILLCIIIFGIISIIK